MVALWILSMYLLAGFVTAVGIGVFFLFIEAIVILFCRK